MTRSALPRPVARLASRLPAAVLVGLLVASFAAPASASADEWTISQAEMKMVELLNANRTAAGLVPVRIDSRLMQVARARSVDMATKHYFSHTQPDGRNVFNILSAKGIKWYGAGEIIAWNNYPTLELSTHNANSQWMNSSGHRAIVMSTTMNYIGVGLAIDASNGKKMWTAVYIKGPDRTGAKSTTKAPIVTAGSSGATRKVTVGWTGADVKLQVLTAGFNSWQVQRRTDGGAWKTIWVTTTRASMTLELAAGHKYEFRTAGLDNAGNWGTWSTVSTTIPLPIGAISTRR
ncbi:MAG TPA: CAP domain-containing protein [Candidatus Limnocylindrales bacterium]|nr:CAP domain-containing protein [Candidatus Limnocylindrales bacterium]